MDTKQDNKAQNFQINTFTKGMNSDTSLDMVSNEQYLFGQNVRITNNSLILGDISPNSKEGIVAPVSSGTEVQITNFPTNIKEILAVQSIENVGVVIVKTTNDKWSVYRIEKSNDSLSATNIFNSTDTTQKHRFSIVLNKELNDVLNLYIADGVHNVMLMNVLQDNTSKKEIDLVSNHIFPRHKVIIVDTISGNLKTSQVQYTYRLYKKYGVCSKLAPLTNKIQIIDNNRNKEIGNAEDTVTSIGLKLQIKIDEDLATNFDHIQLFRLSYIKPGQNAEIDLISDLQYTPASGKDTTIDINDEGIKSLQGLSIDEFSAMYGQNVVPQIIEANQGYLFGANIEDKTTSTQFNLNAEDFIAKSYNLNGSSYTGHINPSADVNASFDQYNGYHYYTTDNSKYIGGESKYIAYRLVTLTVPIHDSVNGDYSTAAPFAVGYDINNTSFKYLIYNNGISIGNDAVTAKSYAQQQSIESNFKVNYDNIFTSSLFRSLRRNETYRYGIVFFNKFGDRTDVFWVADIKTPAIKDFALTSEVSENGNTSLVSNILGVEFTVSNPDPNNIIGYEIVRCQKIDAYSKILLQCALSRPLRQGKYDNDEYRTPWYPNFLISTDFAVVSHHIYKGGAPIPIEGHDVSPYYYYLWKTADGYENDPKRRGYFDNNAGNYENDNIFQIFSSEILIARTNVLNKLSHSQTQLSLIDYINSTKTGQFGMSEIYPYGSPDGLDASDRPTTLFEYAWQHNPNNDYLIRANSNNDKKVYYPEHGILSISPLFLKFSKSSKIDQSYQINLYNTKDYITTQSVGNTVNILNVADVKNPTWEQGFTSIDNGGDNSEIINGVKSYKGYSTSVGGENYVNWICNGMYDLAIYKAEAQAQLGNKDAHTTVYTDTSFNKYEDRNPRSIGWIGPGPVCMLIKTDHSNPGNVLRSQYTDHYGGHIPAHKWDIIDPIEGVKTSIYTFDEIPNVGDFVYSKSGSKINGYSVSRVYPLDPHNYDLELDVEYKISESSWYNLHYRYDNNRILRQNAKPGTLRANITHNATQFSGTTLEQMQYDTYYGFGNFYLFNADTKSNIVCDGDIYIMPCEFISMFKTYDMQSIYDTLQSSQVVYYIPLETKVNTFFDYGCNYRNTQSHNLQLEPGEITGYATQDRPLHQYNYIYSDNDVSNNIYAAKSLEEANTIYTNRIIYSQYKTNGEFIDNWSIFKPADFIDADTRYGQITNLLTDKDSLYFWQNRAFGKLSVNERSLVTDNNGSTIQLGQGGVLQRTDYINTKYGMRDQDYSALSVDDNIYWIDINNKAIIGYIKGQYNAKSVVNYGELLNVQNILNKYMFEDIPTIHYDLQNSELLCGCLKAQDEEYTQNQLVINTKLNAATSIYTRNYDNIISFSNELYGLRTNDNRTSKYNYLSANTEYLSPTILEFAVNSNASQTKVFDNQKIVTLRRQDDDYMHNKNISFYTDLNESGSMTEQTTISPTDREGNICYSIPRDSKYEQAQYFKLPHGVGNRIRGKWMKVSMVNNDPKLQDSISHIITKFRQSYS